MTRVFRLLLKNFLNSYINLIWIASLVPCARGIAEK